MDNIKLEELLEALAKKENVNINIILEQTNIEEEFIESLNVRSLKMYMAIIEPERSDYLSIKKEKCYKTRFGWWFDDEEKIREQVIKFINKEGITDCRFVKLRMTGSLIITEAGVNYKLDRALPWMGWSLIALFTLEILTGLFSAYASHPNHPNKIFPTLEVLSAWLLGCEILRFLFISPSDFIKKGVFNQTLFPISSI
jgi:hypothetical protein